MKLNDFKEIENYQKEREKKELDFILNLTQESFEDKEKEKEWNKLRTSFALYTEGSPSRLEYSSIISVIRSMAKRLVIKWSCA